jgi:hypothetical protein
MSIKKTASLTQQRLREVLVYHDGELYRKYSQNRVKRVGCESTHKVVVMVDSVLHSVHRLVWLWHYGEIPSDKTVHHINGNRFDNRIENLCLATIADSVRSAGFRKSNTSGFKGVSRHSRSDMWVARIKVNWVQKHLGLFDTKEEAYAAYCEAAVKYHGQFANFGTSRQYVRPSRKLTLPVEQLIEAVHGVKFDARDAIEVHQNLAAEKNELRFKNSDHSVGGEYSYADESVRGGCCRFCSLPETVGQSVLSTGLDGRVCCVCHACSASQIASHVQPDSHDGRGRI